MAYANSAQREPSMEEILASIRRIIEENDAAGRSQSGAAEPARAAQPERNVIEVDNFRDETHSQVVESVEAALRQKPLLAEIQAQIAAEAAGLPPRWREAIAEEASSASDEENRSYRHSNEDIAQAIENSRAAREDARAMLGIPEPANSARPSETARAPERFTAPAPAAAAPAVEERPRVVPPHPVEAAPAKRPMVSDAVSRQVSSSFSELSEAFVARSRKTFDEMAEQMIAPLLRDWMENNLPSLVERLVREEIERVARGGQ